jgi:hemoglobin/transferrin/lactoferrin receptor protein
MTLIKKGNLMKKFYFILFLLLMAFGSAAQQLSGWVNDAKYDTPLANVHVILDQQRTGTKTDNSGFFNLKPDRPGTYILKATLIGFKDYKKEVEIEAGDSLIINIYLQPVNIKLDDEVIISARRIGAADHPAPEAITLIGAKELTRDAARTVPEALSGATGVFLQKTNHGGGSPFIRGLTGNQNLMLIDGIRLNNATFRYGPNQYLATIDPLTTERIEVVRGSGSVLYGSDAIGGVVQVFTRNPEYSSRGFKTGGNFMAKWMSRDMEKTGRGEIQLAGEKVAFLGGFTYNDFGDIYAGKGLGKETPTGYTGYSGDGKLRVALGKENEMILAYHYARQDDVPRYDKIITSHEKYHFDPQIRQLGYLRLHLSNKNPWIKKINYVISFGQSDETRLLQKREQEKITTEQDIVNTFGGSVEILSQGSEKWTFTSGVDYYYDKVGSKKTEKLNGEVTEKRGYYTDGSTSTSVAVYTSHNYTLNKFILGAGIRVNGYKIMVEDELFGNVDNQPVAFVWNGSAGYSISHRHFVVGSVYSSFRAPNINDLSSFGSFNYGTEVPNPDLKPERSITYELGYKTSYERFSGSLFLFQNNLSDLIERVPATWNGQDTIESEKVYRKENFASAIVRGIEMAAGYRILPQLSLDGNLTYTYGRNETLDEPMTRIPPLFGRLRMQYDFPSGIWIRAEYLAAGEQSRLSASDIKDTRIPDEGTPGWNLVNLKLGYQWNRLIAAVGVNNVFNEAYRTHGSGVDGYGRNLQVEIRIGF